MLGFVEPEDMENASFIDLKISKRRCDRYKAIFSVTGTLLLIVALLISFCTIVPSVFEEDYREFLLMLGLTVVTLPLIPLGLVFNSYLNRKVFAAWLVLCLLMLTLAVILSSENVTNGMLGLLKDFMVASYFIYAIMYVLYFLLTSYDNKLKKLKGYPYFSNHEEHMAGTAADLMREREKQVYAKKAVDIEEFYQEKKRPDKAEKKPPAEEEDSDITADMLGMVDVEEYFKSVSPKDDPKNSDWLGS